MSRYDALKDIENPILVIREVIGREMKSMYMGDIDKHVKRKFVYKIAEHIANSGKLKIEVNEGFFQGSDEYNAEIFVLTRDDIKKIVENVRMTILRPVEWGHLDEQG